MFYRILIGSQFGQLIVVSLYSLYFEGCKRLQDDLVQFHFLLTVAPFFVYGLPYRFCNTKAQLEVTLTESCLVNKTKNRINKFYNLWIYCDGPILLLSKEHTK